MHETQLRAVVHSFQIIWDSRMLCWMSYSMDSCIKRQPFNSTSIWHYCILLCLTEPLHLTNIGIEMWSKAFVCKSHTVVVNDFLCVFFFLPCKKFILYVFLKAELVSYSMYPTSVSVLPYVSTRLCHCNVYSIVFWLNRFLPWAGFRRKCWTLHELMK